MGRPFIVYDDDDVSGDQITSTSAQTFEGWVESAGKVLGGYSANTPEINALLRYFHSTRRLACIPRAGPVPPSGLSLLDSKVGGLPYLLESESWPTNNGDGLTFLWQFRVQELPYTVRQALGYFQGMLQVFLSECLDEDEGKWYLVRVLEEAQLLPRDPAEVAALVPDPDSCLMEERAVREYERAYDFPCSEDALSALPAGLDADVASEVLEQLTGAGLFCTLPGDKLMGWPNWCQGPEWCRTERGERYVQLVQVEGSLVPFSVGDSGTLLLQRHPTERQEWNVSWACC